VKIGLVCHYFWPEISAPSARLLEMGRAWVARGHEVVVVTNFPNHPTGVIPPAYAGRSFLIEEVDGIRVARCRTYATPNRGVARRTLGHLYFMLQSALQGRAPLDGADVVVVSSPTLFSAVGAWALSRTLGAPLVIEVRDLWPAIFAELGVIRSRVLLRALEALELFLYRRAAAVVTVTAAFARDIARRGIDPAKLRVIPNGVDLEAFLPGAKDEALLAGLGLTGKFVALYCGAHGISHALARILDVAERLRGDDRIRFLFVGEGAEKEDLVATARERALPNVVFHGGVPRERVAPFYRSADACLVPLRDVPVFRSFIPSKIFEILACGRPVVGSVAGEAAEILEASGAAIVVPPEDAPAIAAAVAHLADDAALRETLASRARPYVAAHYDRGALAARYLDVLEAVRPRGGG
jgi:glycosyltransferase involved in cell wall biosynthesis